MVTKNQEDLKRPDLQGKFTCGSCRKIFSHAASLNRHRRDTHKNEHTCLICNNQLEPSEDLHDHMRWQHQIEKVFTCGCCNYTFDNKKSLHEHTQSIKKTGQLGDFAPIAKSSHAPGALLIHRYPASAPYSIPKNRGGSISPTSSSADTSPTSSGSSSQNVSPNPVNKKELAQVKHIASCEKLLNDAVSKILDSKIFSGNELTLPKTWEKIVELGRQMVIEDLEKQLAAPPGTTVVV